MTSCWTQAYLLSVRGPMDRAEEEWSARGRCTQVVPQAQRKRLFEYFGYTGAGYVRICPEDKRVLAVLPEVVSWPI